MTIFSQNSDFISEEEYEVYSVVLKNEIKQSKKRIKRLVIMDSTVSAFEDFDPANISFYINWREHDLREIIRKDSSWWNELIVKSKDKIKYERTILENKFSTIKGKIIIVKEIEIKQLFDKNKDVDIGWAKFHAKYPKSSGRMHLSRVVFSGDNRKAMVYIDSSSWGLVGSGDILFLEKKDDIWEIVYIMNVWVS